MVAFLEVGKTYVISQYWADHPSTKDWLNVPITIVSGGPDSHGGLDSSGDVWVGHETRWKSCFSPYRFVEYPTKIEESTKPALEVTSIPLTLQQIKDLTLSPKGVENLNKSKWVPNYRWPCWHDWVKKDTVNTTLLRVPPYGFVLMGFGVMLIGAIGSRAEFGESFSGWPFVLLLGTVWTIVAFIGGPGAGDYLIRPKSYSNRQCSKCGRIRLDALRYQESQKRKQEKQAERERHKHLLAEERKTLETQVMASIDKAVEMAKKAI